MCLPAGQEVFGWHYTSYPIFLNFHFPTIPSAVSGISWVLNKNLSVESLILQLRSLALFSSAVHEIVSPRLPPFLFVLYIENATFTSTFTFDIFLEKEVSPVSSFGLPTWKCKGKKGIKINFFWFFLNVLLSQLNKSLYFLLLNYRMLEESFCFILFALYSPLVLECCGDCLVFIRLER